MLSLSVFALVGAAFAQPPKIAGCAVFPQDDIWNTPVNSLPLDANSDAYVKTIGADNPLVPDLGSGLYQGGPIGIPFITVAGSQPRVPLQFQYADESDPGPYPIPKDAPIEGGSQSSGDRHVIVLDRDNCVAYEVFSAYPQPDGSWKAGSGAIFDLKSNKLRPANWTSADAAGLSIIAGLVRYDEIAEGEIRHAIRFTVPQSRRSYVWPGTHFASARTAVEYPPMGQRFRLRADFDLSGYSPANRIILTALKKYGMILADNGSPWFISGAPDDRWNNTELRELRRVRGADFEAVDSSPLQIAPDSGQAKQPARAVLNAATFTTGPVAPLEIVTLAGGFTSADVTFNGIPAIVLYSGENQINAVAPAEVAGQDSAAIAVGGAAFDSTWIAEAAPGLFAAIVNADGSLNTPSNAAAKGSVITLYATGAGLAPPTLAVRIDRRPAEVAGAETSGGLLRVAVRVPIDAKSGAVSVVLGVGRYWTPDAARMTVR